jgi:hypothetical protein
MERTGTGTGTGTGRGSVQGAGTEGTRLIREGGREGFDANRRCPFPFGLYACFSSVPFNEDAICRLPLRCYVVIEDQRL